MATVVAGLGAVVAFGALETGDKIASVVSCIVGLAALWVTWLQPGRLGTVDEATGAAWAADLLTGALERLQREASTRGLIFPEPLRVPWRSVGGPFATSPDVVLGRLSGVRRTALNVRGDVTTLGNLVAALPARQVVITGAAGAGKTSAAILLAPQIVREGEVPLLVDMIAWDPEKHPLNEWLEVCLTAVRPASVSVEAARAAAARLVEHRAVVPLLDGLDELPYHLMIQVIEFLHEWDRPFVLTSRTDEYDAVVRTTGLTVAKALVVRLDPLPVPEIVTHLTAGRADAEGRWAAVTARLRTPGPLRETLSTPLMSGMARMAYTPGSSDPRELLALDDVNHLERHLFDRVHPSDGAFAWLKDLARFLDRDGTRQLDLCAPLAPATWSKFHRGFLTCSVISSYLAFVCLFTLFGWFEWSGSVMSMLTSLTWWIGLAVGFLIVRLATQRRDQPVMLYRVRTRPKRMLKAAAGGAVGTIVLTIMDTGSTFIPSTEVLTFLIGIVATSLIGAVVGTLSWGSLTEPVDASEATHLLSAIHRDGWTLFAHLPAPILGAAVYATFLERMDILPQTAAVALIAVTVPLSRAPGTAWSRWVIWSLRMYRHGLPRNLEALLENARERGILRVAGTSYRFQHTKIQDHFACAHKSN
ncbi:hypothetical protein [Saccharothrix sp. Mg75]|uniref:hypothetical protein n=1 Tax=Saccharothrix sp. Mg75 TaxID=3445357 RepID=UPI003EECCEDD